jgi:hypothetical protein
MATAAPRVSPCQIRLENILNRLDEVRAVGSSHAARCPSCGGAGLLLVSLGDCGQVSLRCVRGCSLDAVLDASGIKLHELFPRRSGGYQKTRRCLSGRDG